MNDFGWIEEQCQYTEEDVKYIIEICKYLRHRTIQSYVDDLKRIRSNQVEKLSKLPKSKTKYYQDRISRLDKRLPMLQLMADTHPEDLFSNPYKGYLDSEWVV